MKKYWINKVLDRYIYEEYYRNYKIFIVLKNHGKTIL